MAATRQNPSFQIYQDSFSPQPLAQTAHKPRPQLQPSAMPLQPIRNPQQPYPNLNMTPPMAAPHQQISPLKSQPMSPQIPQYQDVGFVHIPVPSQPQQFSGSPMKQLGMNKAQHFVQPPMPQPMFNTFNSNLEVFPQEFHLGPVPQNESSDFPTPSYARRQTLKRSYSDAASLNDRPIKRLRSDEEAQLPEPEHMPPVEDDGNKPGYSYAQMIGMAILRAPHRRLTLAQIYDWISTTFVFYRDDPKQGWHNSIRHNLSLNKAFKKQERPKGDAGKGSYWIIEPGMESQFFKEKARKSSNIVGIGMQGGMRADIQVMAQPLAEAMTPSWSVPIPPAAVPPRPQTAPALPELSSDATLPASDPALNDDSNDVAVGSPRQPSSPPVMNSSPPVAAGNHHRTISSPVHIRPPPHPRHKRSNTTVDDSGYFSELPSSARRPKASGIILTSEINIERPQKQQKRGRAEEEIIRIRSSPHVTPSSRRLANMLSELDQSSSPVHQSPTLELQPSTPAVHFKKPARKPPASVSPNTQLQQHRLRMQEYTDSPIKHVGLLDTIPTGFSPQYTPMSQFRSSHFDEQFAIFEDSNIPLTPGIASSPLRSIKRPSVLRSSTNDSTLKDASSSKKLNLKTPSKVPSLKPGFRPLKFGGSPLKKSVMTLAENLSVDGFGVFDENTFINDDELDTTLINDENSSEAGDDGFDLYKGFANIGQSQDSASKRSKSRLSRPALGARSSTTAF